MSSTSAKHTKKVHKARKGTGKKHDVYLDEVSQKALESCQLSLSKPHGVIYSPSLIMRRALQHYGDRLKKYSVLLEKEARETRLTAAVILATS